MNLRVLRWSIVVGVAFLAVFVTSFTKARVDAAAPMAIRPGTTQVVAQVTDGMWGDSAEPVFSACHPSDALGQYVRLVDRRTRWSVVVTVDGQCAVPAGADFGINQHAAQALGLEPGIVLAVNVEGVH
ncbi:MAG: hypothetical protein O3A01_03855 [bacterium]|nr:hypothetical protein [bacterium]